MTEFVTIIKYGSYSSGCVSPAKSYCSQHHMVAFFFPFLIDLEQQFVSPVSQHHSMPCLTETTKTGELFIFSFKEHLAELQSLLSGTVCLHCNSLMYKSKGLKDRRA